MTFDDLNITPHELYEQMGYHDNIPDEATLSESQRIVSDIKSFLKPRFCFFVTRFLLTESSLKTSESESVGLFKIGKIIARQLKGSEAFACFVCTAGMEFEDYQRQLMLAGDMVRVFIADALGSLIAEKCCDQMELSLQESVNKLGWKHTNRFSPGYCGWHVSEQQTLFSLFSDKRGKQSAEGYTNPCEVQLTDSSLMIPIKSVSGIIGLGKDVRHLDYTCGLCDFKQCYKRRRNPNKAKNN